MSFTRYLDFDLQITSLSTEPPRYRVHVMNSPVGQANGEFVLPFSELELENFFLRIGRTRRAMRSLNSPEGRAAKEFGSRLYDAVFSNQVQSCLLRSLDATRQQDAGLRLRLRLDLKLMDLPWEYLYDPNRNHFFAYSTATPVVRYLELPGYIQPLTVQPPLRVLTMISNPRDQTQLNVEDEWGKIQHALAQLETRGLVQVTRLENSKLSTLQRQLRRERYHIFHFVGHGGFDYQNDDGVLLLEDENGLSRLVSGHTLGALFQDHPSLRLALLNACEGGRTSRSDAFSGVATHLIQQGIPAVIAMQFEITDTSAIRLSQEFYSALADGYPVDSALTEARKAIFTSGNDIEWGTPVLYLRSPNGNLFDLQKAEFSPSQVLTDNIDHPVLTSTKAELLPTLTFNQLKETDPSFSNKDNVQKETSTVDLNTTLSQPIISESYHKVRNTLFIAMVIVGLGVAIAVVTNAITGNPFGQVGQRPQATSTIAIQQAARATEITVTSEVLAATKAITNETSAASSTIMTDCTPATEGELAGVDPNGQTVVWWHNHSASREEGLKGLIVEFNSSNPCGITIDFQNQGSYYDIRDQVNASISAGEQPAALIVGYQNDQAFYQLNDTLADLNLYVNDAKWGFTAEEQADFYPTFLKQSVHPVFDNQRLGFPPNRAMEVLYYNATLLKELGYDAPPTTPEEFKEMACAAHAADPNNKGYLLRDDASALASWTYAFGGNILNEVGDGYVLNSQATVDALTLLKSMYDEGCANFLDDPAGFPNAEFAARRALFTQGSSSGIPFYAGDTKKVAEEAGRDADEWGVAAIPHTTADPVQNIYGGDVMITITSPEQQLAAWVFIKWFTSPETQAKWDQISGYFPTRQSTVDNLQEYLTSNPQWAQAVELLPYSAYEPQLISYTGVRDAMTQAFNEIIQGAEIQATLDALNEDANAQQEELMSEVQ